MITPQINIHSIVAGVTSAMTDTSDTSVIAAPSGPRRIFVTSLTVINSHSSTDTVVELKSGSTVLHRGFAKSGGGGYSASFPTPLIVDQTTALTAACVSNGSNVYVSASGFLGAP